MRTRTKLCEAKREVLGESRACEVLALTMVVGVVLVAVVVAVVVVTAVPVALQPS